MKSWIKMVATKNDSHVWAKVSEKEGDYLFSKDAICRSCQFIHAKALSSIFQKSSKFTPVCLSKNYGFCADIWVVCKAVHLLL